MGVSITHLFRQGPVIKSLIRTVASSKGGKSHEAGSPGDLARAPVLEQTVEARHPKLIEEYIRHVGGQPSWYRGTLPPHLFPQWGFPLLARTLEGLPYNMSRVLNGGSRIEIHHPLPSDRPLHLKAQLVEVDDNGSRVIFRQKLVTGTDDEPEALVSYVNAILPLKRSDGPKKEKPRVPEAAREIAQWKLNKKAGLEFALLTGDFNPVHWVAPYARMSGFPRTILHGFSTMARTIETLNAVVWLGRPRRLSTFEARFVKPLVFPGSAGVYIDGTGGVFVGKAPGGPACLTANYTTREE